MSFTNEEKKAIVEQIGEQATEKLKPVIEEAKNRVSEMEQKLIDPETVVTKKEMKDYMEQNKESFEKLNELCLAQGTTLAELKEGLSVAPMEKGKSIAEKLREDKEDIDYIKKDFRKITSKNYVLGVNKDGKITMTNLEDVQKTTVHGTIDAIETGSTASISQSMSGASILRLGLDSEVFNQYRKEPTILDLVSSSTASINSVKCIYIDENEKLGDYAPTAEGATNPKVKYSYTVRSADYEKVTGMLNITDEFHNDAEAIEENILSVGRADLINKISDRVRLGMETSATAFDIAQVPAFASFSASGYNDYVGIAAMASQAEKATLGNVRANASLIGTDRKYYTGVQVGSNGQFIGVPPVLGNIAMTGIPEYTNQIITGDLRQYNVKYKGGVIVRIGYDDGDFASNSFSISLVQYFYDWISSIRAKAIVSSDFATLETAITT